MNQQEFKASVRNELTGKLTEIIRAAYEADQTEVREPDYSARNAKQRRDAEISERAHNCPRGEWR